jgi:hypothetical protein
MSDRPSQFFVIAGRGAVGTSAEKGDGGQSPTSISRRWPFGLIAVGRFGKVLFQDHK